MENEECTFKEFVFDVLKFMFDGYKDMFINFKKGICEIPDVIVFIAKAIYKHKKESLTYLSFMTPILVIYFLNNYIGDNPLLFLISVVIAIVLSVLMQFYYFYLHYGRKKFNVSKS
jgi:hypothetical protein